MEHRGYLTTVEAECSGNYRITPYQDTDLFHSVITRAPPWQAGITVTSICREPEPQAHIDLAFDGQWCGPASTVELYIGLMQHACLYLTAELL